MHQGRRLNHLPLRSWLLLAPALLMLLVPASIMPVRQSDGSLTIVICTGSGPLELRVDPDTGQPVEGEDIQTGSACHWNLLRDTAMLPETGAPVAAAAGFARPTDTTARTLPHRRLHFERPPARASPFLT